MSLISTIKGNPIPGYSSFGGQSQSYGSSPSVSIGGNVKKDIDPMLSPNKQTSAKSGSIDLGSLLGFGSGIATNIASAREAQKQRDWQERMSNTAWQRQAKDLQAAGLNRILGYTKGQSASTPSGGIAQMKDPMASSLAARRLNQEIKNLQAQEISTLATARATTLSGDIKTVSAQLMTIANDLLTQMRDNTNAKDTGYSFKGLENLIRRLNELGSKYNPFYTGELK